MTEWHTIPGWEGLYEITTDGRVRSLGRVATNGNCYRGGEMTVSVRGKYKVVQLRKVLGSRKKTESIHRLLALSLIPNPDNLPCVNHIDGDPQNNDLANLEWCTHAQNMAHAKRSGLMAKPGLGKSPGNAKLSKEQVIGIRREYAAGGISSAKLAQKHGLGHWVVKGVVFGRNYRHVDPA